MTTKTPAPISPAVDPELPRTPVPVLRPSAVAPAPVPTPYRSDANPGVVLPVQETPVEENPPAESENRNIMSDPPRYVAVLEDGTVVVKVAAQLNFSGSGVSVTAQGSTANIVITGGSSNYSNANVAAFLAAFGSNILTTTGNVTANYFIGDGSQLTNLPGGGGLPIANGTSNFNIATVNGNATVTAAGARTWTFDTTGNLTIPGSIVGTATIDIDNRASGNSADINLFSADDITIQARDRSAGSGAEGGDIQIFAGDSAEDGDSSGGDVTIEAGNGGAANVDFGGSGGTIRIQTGQGGAASTGVSGEGAYGGGELILRAGDAGSNNGNIARGAQGGGVVIEAGDSTGNLDVGGSINLRTGAGGPNAAAGAVIIDIPSSDQGPGGEWIFDATGNIILPSNTASINYANGTPYGGGGSSTGDITFSGANISAPDDAVIRIQAKDSDSVVRSYVRLDPDNGYAEMRALSSQRTTGFTAGDWATGVWTGTENNADLAFTGATDIVAFLNGAFGGSTNQTISVNGGEPMALGGYSTGGSDVTFFVDVAPPADPTTITSIDFGYYYSSRIEIDYDDDEINIRGNDLDININSTERIDIGATNSVEIVSDTVVSLLNNSTTEPIVIRTNNGNTNQTWEFSASGNLTLPRGGVVYETNIPYGGLTGNTIALLPQGGTSADQQLLVYPTAGQDANHLHLTTGNLYNTELFLGNDNLYVKLANTGDIVINSNDNTGNTAQWTFGTNATLTFPGGDAAIVPDQGGTTAFQGAANTGVVVTSSGNTGSVTTSWVDQTEDMANARTASMTLNVGGTADAQIQVADLGANSVNNWTFDNTGNLTLPSGGHIVVSGGIVGSGASPAPTLSGFSSVSAQTLSATGNVTVGNISTEFGSISTGGNVNGNVFNGNVAFGNGIVGGAGNITGGNLITTGRVSATGNIVTGTQIQSSAFTGGNISWSANNQIDFQGAIKVGGTGRILSPGGAASIETNNNGANIPQLRVTSTAASANTTSGALIVSGGAGVAGNVYIGGLASVTGNITGGNISATGTVTAAGKIGYASGSTVTQTTNRGTSVTINALAGTIVTVSASMVATQIDTFGVANDQVDPNNDIVLVQIVSPNFGMYNCIAQPSAIINGFVNGFFVNIQNISGGPSSNEAITVRFMVIKAPNA